MTKRTKRFLFFTGGSDSALLLIQLIKLIKKFKKDELVIVLVANQWMRSGQDANIKQALGMIMGNLIDTSCAKNKDLMARISVLVMNQGTITQDTIDMNGEGDDGQEYELSLNVTQANQDITKYRTAISAQELIVLSTTPSMVTYLGCCTNKFYIGACGSDIATRTTDKLKQIFNLSMEVMTMMGDSNELEHELKHAGYQPIGRTGGNYFDSNWIPTLEFPLQNLTKPDVIMLLENERCQHYIIDKAEDLLTHYSNADGFKMASITKVYHGYRQQYLGKTKDFPSLLEFIQNQKLTFTQNGNEVLIDEDEVAARIQNEMMRHLGRGLGISLSDLAQMIK
ncbi:hypothetical protein OTK49_02295 [Vibrio coralliirubri]|uniref:hypothetical protein n=1 Tax=Vibrio coralliirubri TaxID=1516159 RepID=UPI002283CF99|nr:hypothetical protein [Vibrio coralliirubri]MCY9861346.1 hypothetical protein [Vibrio coralliirubri]